MHKGTIVVLDTDQLQFKIQNIQKYDCVTPSADGWIEMNFK